MSTDNLALSANYQIRIIIIIIIFCLFHQPQVPSETASLKRSSIHATRTLARATTYARSTGRVASMSSTASRFSARQVGPPPTSTPGHRSAERRSFTSFSFQDVNSARLRTFWCSRTLAYKCRLAPARPGATRSALAVPAGGWRIAWRCRAWIPTRLASEEDRRGVSTDESSLWGFFFFLFSKVVSV